jgi:hypothetical protein
MTSLNPLFSSCALKVGLKLLVQFSIFGLWVFTVVLVVFTLLSKQHNHIAAIAIDFIQF